MLYPLKFTPILKSKIWGGQHIKEWYRPASDALENVGETWVVSAFEEFASVVCNGHLQGNELQELLEVYMEDLVGGSVYETFGNTFPLLVKYIDAADNLSVQVHPNDEQAWEKEESLGKTEMWYVMEGSSDDASIVLGWQRDTSAEEVEDAVTNGKLDRLMRTVPVKAGDVVMLNAGTVHALKRGSIVAEIQENSDITYRLYDYDRVDNEGHKRQLHLNDALSVLNYDGKPQHVISPDAKMNGATNLISSPFFVTNLLTFDRVIERDYAPLDSFVIYMCVNGEARVTALEVDKDAEVVLRMGEAVLLPASLNDIRIEPLTSSARFLETYVDMLQD